MSLHYVGKHDSQKLRVFTYTSYIVLPTNMKKNVQIITCLQLNHALLLVRYLINSVKYNTHTVAVIFFFSNTVHQHTALGVCSIV